MGSKKHKKESKKRKHRSRSRSPHEGEVNRSRSPAPPLETEDRDRERRRHHKKHKDRRKERSPDVEEVPVDSHLAAPSRSTSSEEPERDQPQRDQPPRDQPQRDQPQRDQPQRDQPPRDRPQRDQPQRDRRPRTDTLPSGSDPGVRAVSPGGGGSGGPRAATSSGAAHESLSVEETNRIRAKLGLKPLDTADKPPAEDGKLKDDLGEFYHVPATNIAQQKKTDKIRERLQERHEKRKLEQKFQTRLLAEGESDAEGEEGGASAWVQRSRRIEKQKREAAKQAALLDEMDEAFGVSALVAAEERAARAHSYTSRALRGLRVAHDLDALGSERDVVLTLADRDVLAPDHEDVLVNVNIVDQEKYNKNIEERAKARSGYKAYDDEAELQAAALGLQQRPVLAKYDEEIDAAAASRRRGFVIGDQDALDATRHRQMMMRERMQEKRLESLILPDPRIASDYYDEHELQAKFKKPKKKGKIRKRAKQEPIDVEEYDPTAPLDTDDTAEVKPEAVSLPVDEDELEPDSELQAALARARRLRQQQHQQVPKVEELLERVKEEEEMGEDGTRGEEGSCITLDATAEFCRTLGDIPTYGQAGNRDHSAEILDFESEETEMETDVGGEGAEGGEAGGGAWSRVDVRDEQPGDIAAGSSVALDAEPSLGRGAAGALQLALSKGYLDRDQAAPAPRSQHKALIAALHYSIEDKTYGEDDKHGRRERGGGGYAGPLQDFREKSHFKPNIKLEYVDDDGRPLCPKEAFRYLSHKFHGKGPGKNKQEKRIKKAVQEGLMKKMSSTDTPLNTLALLQEKQKETHSPYVLLSGANKHNNN